MGKSKLHLADLAAGFCSKTVTVCLISKGNGAFQMEVAISWDATISHHPGLPLLCRVSAATRGREKGKCQITIFMNLLPRQCWWKKKKWKNQFHLHPISWQACARYFPDTHAQSDKGVSLEMCWKRWESEGSLSAVQLSPLPFFYTSGQYLHLLFIIPSTIYCLFFFISFFLQAKIYQV